MALDEVSEYIMWAARKRGIDPQVALRVAQHEGGTKNPFRHGEGPAPRSQSRQFGNKENSYGPFQLYISGTGAGLGDRALRAGIDPRKNWKGGVDFALDEVVKKGWGQWYGAKAAGVTGFHGVGKNAKATGEYNTADTSGGDGGSAGGAIPTSTVTNEPEEENKWVSLAENLGNVGSGMTGGGDEQYIQPTPNMPEPDVDFAQGIPADYWQNYMQTAAQGGVIQHLDAGGTVADPDEDDGTRFNEVLKMMGLIA